MTATPLAATVLSSLTVTVVGIRLLTRRRRTYTRLAVEPYRTDRLVPDALVGSLAAIHALLAVRGPRRLVVGQASISLEIHHDVRASGAPLVWLAITAPAGVAVQVAAAIRSTYPNCRLRRVTGWDVPDGPVVRLHKRRVFTLPVRRIADVDPDRPPVERLLRAMAAGGGPSVVQIALTPAPVGLSAVVRSAGRRPASEGDAERLETDLPGLVGPYFWADVRLVGRRSAQLAPVAAELRTARAANRLVGRRSRGRRRAWARRVDRGEANPVPSVVRSTYAAEEVAGLWHLPSPAFTAVALVRCATPRAPAPAGVRRAGRGTGLMTDAHGPVTIHTELRRQNTAVVGTVEQGKTSYLVASVREDLRRDDCAVIVLDPKGDAADAALSVVPDDRVCTLLDMARPTCGFNPLGVAGRVDGIADHVVAAVRGLFADGEVRGSSDRYLRNAVIGALAFDPAASLWDVARLLEVGSAGTAARALVADRLAGLPEFAEVASFLADELPVQLRDARSATTAKLDAPANKLARVLNSASVKRILLNESVRVDFDRLIDQREVLVVRGALGELGPGNVGVLMQLLLGMLDAALGRAQDRAGGGRRTAVALKVDEAPLVINEAFAQTIALKRSAGLETVACWQTDAQWPVELRDQLDAMFAHRVLFATASAIDARAGAGLLMAEFADQLRLGDQTVATLAAPDVRLHLPRHTAVVSWTTPAGRDRPFIGRTIPMRVDPARLERLARLQADRGAREVDDLTPVRRLDGRPDTRVALTTAPGETVQPAPVGVQPPPTALQPAPTAVQLATTGVQQPPTALQPRATAAQPAATEVGRAPGGADQAPAGTGRAPAGVDQAPAGMGRAPAGVDQAPAGVDQAPAGVGRAPGGVVQAPTMGSAASEDQRAERSTGEPAGTFGELVAVDAATSVRWLPVSPAAGRPRLDAREVELLSWIAGARCALTSQAHRRTSPGQALTGTQRRVKRLADAGLVARFQLYGGDGGGVPFGCSATQSGLDLLDLGGRRPAVLDDAHLGMLTGDLHTVGWLLALEARAGADVVSLLGPGRARVAPPTSAGVDRLELEAGVHARDFVRSAGDPADRRPVESFVGLSPSAAVEVRVGRAGRRTDLLVFHDPAERGRTAGLLERCDHLVAGWWRLVPRYVRQGGPPTVVILGRDVESTRRIACQADGILVACLARIGERPDRWAYPSRAGVVFAVESDLHDGLLDGWRLPELPPTVRGRSTVDLRWGPVVELAGSSGDASPGAGSQPPPWR